MNVRDETRHDIHKSAEINIEECLFQLSRTFRTRHGTFYMPKGVYDHDSLGLIQVLHDYVSRSSVFGVGVDFVAQYVHHIQEISKYVHGKYALHSMLSDNGLPA